MAKGSASEAGDSKGGALARGLSVLVAVNDLETGTLANLVEATGLAKPTVIRLLGTLIDEGYVQKDPETLTYSAASKAGSLARAFVGRDRESVALQEILDDLAYKIKWPTEFLVPDGSSMVIERNNRDKAPIKLRLFERRRFPMFQSGAGIAYASSRSPEELDALVRSSGLSPADQEAARERVKTAILKGYSLYQYKDLAPNLSVMSILIPGAIGALSVPHFDDVLPENKATEYVLPRLREAAKEIMRVKI